MSSKVKKASKQQAAPKEEEVAVWTRLLSEGIAYAGEGTAAEVAVAMTREVNEAHIQELLKERWEAKRNKNYEVADQNATALKMMRIAYHDETKTWNTLPLSTANRAIDISSSGKRKRTKKQERNRRQAEKNRRKQAGLGGGEDGGSPSGGDDSEAEDGVQVVEPKQVAKKKKVSA